MRRPNLTREKVLATVVRLLEVSLIRIGNEEYAKENKSFGLTTMRNRHVEVDGSTLRFQFRGKSAKRHMVELSDRRLATIVRKCQDLPGQQLFEYLDPTGKAVPIASEDVNDYLQTISGQPLPLKIFGPGREPILAAIALGKMEEVDSQVMAKKNVVTAIEAVAGMLAIPSRSAGSVIFILRLLPAIWRSASRNSPREGRFSNCPPPARPQARGSSSPRIASAGTSAAFGEGSPSAQMMKIALFHNPAAARAMLKGSKLVRQFENAGYEVFYVSIKGQDWEGAFREPFDRVVIAGPLGFF